MKTEQLAIPASINPKPRKSDIIKALVERARQRHVNMVADKQKKVKLAKAQLEEALLVELKNHSANFDISFSSHGYTPSVEYQIKVIPPHIKALQKEVVKADTYIPPFNATQVRKEIEASLAGRSADPVKAMLANTDMVQKLDSILEQEGIV